MNVNPTADGRCAIEPYIQKEALRAYSTPLDFNQAVNRLIGDCVLHNTHTGGVAFNYGMPGFASFIQVNEGHVMSMR